jgi:hypothetical protein
MIPTRSVSDWYSILEQVNQGRSDPFKEKLHHHVLA